MTEADRPTRGGRPRRVSTDAAIDDATRRLLVEVGYSGLTIEAVAAAAGVGKPTVYRRHRSKASLVAAALLDTLAAVNPEVPDSGDVVADTRQLLGNLARALRSTDFGRAITEIVSPAAREAELADLFRDATAQRRVLIREVLTRASEQNRLIPADVDTAIDLALGAIYFRHLITHGPIDDPFVDGVVSSIVTASPPH